MQLSNEHISAFQSLYKDEFGEDISYDQAREQAASLVRLMQLIYCPISKKEHVRVQTEIETIIQRINKRK